jgi:nucleotide-binding universal stress UspA family protein
MAAPGTSVERTSTAPERRHHVTPSASGTHSEAAPKTHRLLVCLDGSPLSEVCVPYAVFLAKTFGSAVSLVHVLEPRHEHSGSQTNDVLGWEIGRQQAQGYLDQVAERVSRAVGRPVDTKLEQGRPAERLVDLAGQLHADLSLLGSRGDGGGSPMSLGSTVQQVLSLSRSSVFIAHSSLTTPALVAPRRIFVPLDGSPRSEAVLPAVARIARTFDAEILLVHVVQEPLSTPLLRAPADMGLARSLSLRLESGAGQYLKELREQLLPETPSVRTLVVRHANEYRCLLEISEREHVDLLVLSAHGSGCDSTQSFGSVTAYLLTHSPVPLMVLQDLPVKELHNVQNGEDELTAPELRASYAPGNV